MGRSGRSNIRRAHDFGSARGWNLVRSIPQDTGSTSPPKPWSDRSFAASGVGVVMWSARLKIRLKSRHASRPALILSRSGMWANWKRLSGMKWFVATIGTPARRAAAMAARPTTKWPWVCSTSGLMSATSRSSRVGTVTRMVGWTSSGAERSRCTTTPSTTSALAGPASDWQTTCTSLPRAARPVARRWVK